MKATHWLGLVLAVSLGLTFSPWSKKIRPVKLYAQTLPVTKTLAWDANPTTDAIINYTVTLDGVVIGSPTGTTQIFTVGSAGNHTFTVTATNLWGTSGPATLLVTVIVPQTPRTIRIAPAP